MWERRLGPTAVLLAVLLAGCTGSGAGGEDEDFDDLGLQATQETGIVRCVVVDEAIRPVAEASVAVVGLGLETTTDAQGRCGFADIPPGTHFLEVTKAGFKAARQSVEVQAAVQEPPVVKILLQADPATMPFVDQYKFAGYIECSFSLVAFGIAACSTLGTANDVFMEEYDLARTPDWAQGEMAWESTQALGDRMTLLFSAPGEDVLYTDYAEAEGTSPLRIEADQATLEAFGVGEGSPLMVRVFNAPVEGTSPPDPVDGDDCVDRPVLGGCLTGLGMTLNQEFTVYTHTFYNVVPDPGWSFIEDGEYPM